MQPSSLIVKSKNVQPLNVLGSEVDFYARGKVRRSLVADGSDLASELRPSAAYP